MPARESQQQPPKEGIAVGDDDEVGAVVGR